MTDITMVLTSCDRHDLLKTTLDSFHQLTDMSLDESIIVEDSSASRPEWLTEASYPKLGRITWLQNEPKLGQMLSIDRAYAEVHTNFIFHCEDDWTFIRGDFMQKSMDILNQYPEISMVALTTILNNEDSRYPFPIVKAPPAWDQGWCYLSFNPGLRRMSDYKKLGPYTRLGHEIGVSYAYKGAGFLMADLGVPGHVLHSGNDRHVPQ